MFFYTDDSIENQITQQQYEYFEQVEEIISIIFQDDYNELISFLSKYPNFKIDREILISTSSKISKLFDINSISLLDLCCLLGSNNCFKYFYTNDCEPSPKANEYCIIGGNFEIIQILNYHNIINFNNCIKTSIEYHQYSISDWLLANYQTESISESDCIRNYNFQFLLFNHYNEFHYYDFLVSDYKYRFESNLINHFYYLGYFTIVEYLNVNGFNKYEYKNNLYLHYACKYCDLPTVQYLITLGFNIESKDHENRTPLHLACLDGNLPIVECLIKNGCNKESLDDKEYRCTHERENSPLHLACVHNYDIIREYLLLGKKSCQDKIDKIIQDDVDRTLQYKRIYESEIKRKGKTPLHYACMEGHLPIVKYLFDNGCDKEFLDDKGKTPLHWACERGHLPIVEYLITIGCNKEFPDDKGKTPLHYACKNGHLSIVKYLIIKGCNKEIQDRRKRTPLHYACEKGHLPIVECLMKSGCNKES